eukprot:TRINITY_DN4757_c0_g1_i2.p1 TRINITY_DN4757_c0_g1~~TRINITY_DN4757_c0_g1_i2.p1  ORF type:complete len:581 (+),score=94.89 TRINITY_DN4757_c0_g1_i2:13-1755(+)
MSGAVPSSPDSFFQVTRRSHSQSPKTQFISEYRAIKGRSDKETPKTSFEHYLLPSPPQYPPPPTPTPPNSAPISSALCSPLFPISPRIETPNLAPDVAEKLAKKQKSRKERATEMMETEKTYVNSLQIIFDKMIEPLQTKAENEKERILRYNQIMDIFSNWETILTLHKRLLDKIINRMRDWTDETHIGDIFAENTAWIKLYKHYVNNFDNSIIALETCKKNHPEFFKMMQKLDYSEMMCGLNLQAYLILPVQRIPRYVLLIQDLLKFTEQNHQDYELLNKALVIIKEVADYVNANKSSADHITKLHNISTRITDYPKKEDPLVQPKRNLLREGCLHWKKQRYYVFLFNDVVLFTKPIGKRYKFRFLIKLSTAMLNSHSSSGDHHFEIMSPSGAFRLTADPSSEKDLWIKEIQDSIEGSKQNMISSALGGGPKTDAEGSKKFKQLEEEKNTKKRKESVLQLVEKEREYYNSIVYIQTVFFEPISQLPEAIISAKDRSDIFMNLEQLTHTHQSLLEALETRWSGYENNTQIGDLFLNLSEPLLKQYPEYISNYAKAKHRLECCYGYSQFAVFLLVTFHLSD